MKTAANDSFPIGRFLSGWVTAFFVTVILAALLSAIFGFVGVSDSATEKIQCGAKYFSAFLAGLLCARGGKKRGWLTGSCAALVYTAALCGIGMCIYGTQAANPYILRQLGIAALCGAVGGIVGINSKKG